jgi:hypothetical protein
VALADSVEDALLRRRTQLEKMAQRRTGRLLVQIGQQQFSGRQPHEVLPLSSLWSELWRSERPSRHGIYDVTDFSPRHPGIELKDAAELVDATEWFEMNGHSDEALRKLATLAVPTLEALPYDRELEEARRRRTSPLRSAVDLLLRLSRLHLLAFATLPILLLLASEVDLDGPGTPRHLWLGLVLTVLCAGRCAVAIWRSSCHPPREPGRRLVERTAGSLIRGVQLTGLRRR